MASTSAHTVYTSTPKWNYEVFLSFRGEDTRKNFVDHLFAALCQRGIHTFKDDEELRRGENISPSLLTAIEESRFCLIVFSKNYASSKWCLDELVKIVECKKTMGQTVVPVFYDVDPSEVRKQTGSFGSAFEIHEKAFSGNMEKVQRWKTALVEAANMSGYSVPDTANGHESKCIVQIVEEIFNKLNHTSPFVAQYLVGAESRVEKMKSLLSEGLDEVRFIGIWGMGGIGKTTIARAVYDRIYHQFEGSCFLANVREISEKQGLEALQKQLLSEILIGSNINITDTVRGANIIISRLRFKRVLVVIDDVDKQGQLDAIAGEHGWFGIGSRIIITTRDKHLLTAHGVNESHTVEALNDDEAIQLLSLKAFQQSFPSKGYVELSNQIVDYAGGLPLALTILGSFLYGRKTDEWKSTLIKLHKIPNKEILQVLKISFDGLDEMEKEIFLDIACFFKGKHECLVTRILDSCGFCPRIGIPVLIEKSLITISGNEFWMHDLIQEMGWYIVRQESEESWKRSRLWLREDVCYVLTNDTGSEKVEAICLELPEPDVVDLNFEAFTKMKKLRLFKVHNVVFSKGPAHLPNELRCLDWHAYPSNCLPASFQAKNLVELSMCYSSIKRLWKIIKPLTKLKVVNLSHSHRLFRTPDFTVIPNLETLILEDCTSLVEVHPSIGVLKRLVFLSLKDCKNLKRFPNVIHMESLETFILSGCLKLGKCPEILGDMVCLSELYLDKTAIKELPPSIEHLTSLTLMNLSECKRLTSLPRTICRLRCLKTLILSGCSKLEKFMEILVNMECLSELYLDRTTIKELPSSIEQLTSLTSMDLSECKYLTSLPRTICRLSCLKTLSLCGCSKLEELPDDLGNIKCLEVLHTNKTAIKQLPSSINLLEDLKVLSLSGCKGKISESFFSSWFLPRKCEDSLCLVLPSLTGLNSLTKLDLSDCNLSEGGIPSDLGSLSSLLKLNLSRNNFVSLPASISLLSQLETLKLVGCKRLEALPKLPSRILKLLADDCQSLVSIGDLSTKRSLQRVILTNCFKLFENKWNGNAIDVLLRFLFQVCVVNSNFSILLPGREIPELFRHQSLHASISLLSQLETLKSVSCKSLEALPKHPSRILKSMLDDCQSLLESVGDLSTKRALQRVMFTNCFEFENKWNGNGIDVLMRFLFQRPCVVNTGFSILLPGREIPELFSHQNLGTYSNLQLPPDWWNERYIGIAACAVFEFATTNLPIRLLLHLVALNNNRPCTIIGSSCISTNTNVDSEHITLSYYPTHPIWREDRNPNEWCQLEVYSLDPVIGLRSLLPKKWGFHLVCEEDVKKWRDEAAAVEDKNNTLKREHDDCDEAQGNESPRAKREYVF